MVMGKGSLIPQAIIHSTPDWRWRWVAGVPSLVRDVVPVSEAEVPDETIRCRLLPFCRRCYGLRVDMPEDVYSELRSAHTAYNNKWSYRETAPIYEACALAGVSHDGGTDIDPIQRAYEDIFFDVRPCLNNVEDIVELVFTPMLEDMPLNAREFENKIVAYTLGDGHLQRWLHFDDTKEILALRARLTRLEAFRTSLVDLGLPVENAWSRALCRLIRSARDNSAVTAEVEFIQEPDWQGRLQRLMDTVSAAC